MVKLVILMISLLLYFSQTHQSDWVAWLSHVSPFDADLPSSYTSPTPPLQRLLLLRAIAPQKVIAGVESYVRDRLGPDYVSPPQVPIIDLYRRMSPHTPAVLLLSEGRDPSDEVARFAEVMGMRVNKSSISSGGGRTSISAVLGHGLSISVDSTALPQLAQVRMGVGSYLRDCFYINFESLAFFRPARATACTFCRWGKAKVKEQKL